MIKTLEQLNELIKKPCDMFYPISSDIEEDVQEILDNGDKFLLVVDNMDAPSIDAYGLSSLDEVEGHIYQEIDGSSYLVVGLEDGKLYDVRMTVEITEMKKEPTI
jgi:hypothetical protein